MLKSLPHGVALTVDFYSESKKERQALKLRAKLYLRTKNASRFEDSLKTVDQLPNNPTVLCKSSDKLIFLEDMEACSPVQGISGLGSELVTAAVVHKFKPKDIIEMNERLYNILSRKKSAGSRLKAPSKESVSSPWTSPSNQNAPSLASEIYSLLLPKSFLLTRLFFCQTFRT